MIEQRELGDWLLRRVTEESEMPLGLSLADGEDEGHWG